jgi:hypothetical protein
VKKEQAAWAAAVALGLCVATVSAQTQVAAPGEAIERAGTGKINWTGGWVETTGLGAPPAKAPAGQARAMAQRAAHVVALRNLLEIVKGVRVDSATLVENYMVTNDVIKTQVSGFVKGAVTTKTEVQADGAVEVTVRMPLWGSGTESLITAFMDEKAVKPQAIPAEPASDEGPTGLVIDARGLGVKPAFFPVILDPSGAVVYGPEMVDRPTAEQSGAVGYQVLPKNADLSSVFGDAYVIRPVAVAAGPREGRRPLKVKGADKAGVLSANVMISSEDAKKIRSDAQMTVALKRSKVVIVTDPLIGGMEGRVPSRDGLVARHSQ